MEIIAMRKGHTAVLAELERLCFSRPWSQASLEAEINNPNACFLVAVRGEEVLGYAGMHCVLDECYMDNIAVFPTWRHRGVGRALLTALECEAKKRGGTFLSLEVRPSNTAAVEMYKSMGFREEGRRREFYESPAEDGLILTKRWTRFFTETVENWKDWGRVFQSAFAFTDLVRAVCEKEALPFAPLKNMTPGTNGVFRVGDMVAKIFFPRESGLDPLPDFQNEAVVYGRMEEMGIPVPKVIAKGFIEDEYRFYYIFTEYCPGMEAGKWLRAASAENKVEFARNLRAILRKLNRPVQGLIAQVDLLKRAVENPRLEKLPAGLREEMVCRAKRLDLSDRVLVHGDLTGENILVNEAGELTVIDCADARLAPAWYEYGPIVFDLFRCDPVLLRGFAGEDREGFIQKTLDAVCIHDFGADLLEGRFASLKEAQDFLRGRLGLL